MRKVLGNRYIHFLDCDDHFMSVYVSQNLPNSVLQCIQFIVNTKLLKL